MRTTLFIILVSLFSLSCTKERLSGNGNIITDLRSPGQFTGVHSSGASPIKVLYGTQYKVEVKGSSNLIPVYESKVRGGTLYLGYERAEIRNDDIEVTVTMPAIESASMSGSGDLTVAGSFAPADAFRLSISGSSDVRIDDDFVADDVRVTISGSGEANLEKISARSAQVNISGSGDVRLSVANDLRARISGSGKVYCKGNAVVDANISGSGQVIKY